MHIKVRKTTIGKGIPKICVPITAGNKVDIIVTAQEIMQRRLEIDLVEWRVDFFADNSDFVKVIAVAKRLREILVDVPLLFTYRTENEGGAALQEFMDSQYFSLCELAIESGYIDLIDVELYMVDSQVEQQDIIGLAKQHNVALLISNHDFIATPKRAEIINRLCKMQELGADICKIAVMPRSRKDVLTLLNATETMYSEYATVPIVTISMGALGMISRLAGEVFGSAITFGAVENISAPGQLPVEALAKILPLLHN